MNQLTLGADFDGPCYDSDRDRARLTGQILDVYNALYAYRASWLTVKELADRTSHPECSVSAQCRHLRQPKYGGLDVQRRYREGTRLSEYRLFIGGNDETE